MTWASRIKLFVGIIGVLIIAAGLTLVFNQRQSQATSTSASLDAERFPVGIDYGGTVLSSRVKAGDRVTKGETLFTLQSPSLQADLAKGLLKPETITYTVTEEGVITLTAAVAGTVSDVMTETGSFVRAGQVLATIDRAGSLFVTAEYELSAREYSRVEDGAAVRILLPNQATVSGTVESIDVQTVRGSAQTTVKVKSDGLVDGAYNGLVKRGTPVTASLTLRDDGILSGVSDGFFAFVRKIGL
ncbi:MAG: HlyD family secretion protein [Actinomycetota bacterium]